MAVTLERAKQHLEVDFEDKDDLITLYLAAAEAWALKYCNRSEVPSGAEEQFDIAILLMVADLFNNREINVGDYTPSPNVKWMIDPFRLLRV
jgi:uncharacterized phage protein (predicted DNA packaging)